MVKELVEPAHNNHILVGAAEHEQHQAINAQLTSYRACCRSIVPSDYNDPAMIILATNDYNCDVGENTHKEDHHVQLLSRQGE
jgi:hypothetical protein